MDWLWYQSWSKTRKTRKTRTQFTVAGSTSWVAGSCTQLQPGCWTTGRICHGLEWTPGCWHCSSISFQISYQQRQCGDMQSLQGEDAITQALGVPFWVWVRRFVENRWWSFCIDPLCVLWRAILRQSWRTDQEIKSRWTKSMACCLVMQCCLAVFLVRVIPCYSSLSHLGWTTTMSPYWPGAAGGLHLSRTLASFGAGRWLKWGAGEASFVWSSPNIHNIFSVPFRSRSRIRPLPILKIL